MKKIFAIGLMGLMGVMGTKAQAQQFGTYGVTAGLGLATIDDDLSTKSPILGATVGGYVTFNFAQSESVLAETFFLQTGLNLNRRGGNFEEILEKESDLNLREGYYHTYYLQLPILACMHYELPIRQSGHVVGVFLGPAVNFGLFGRYSDRKIHPGSPATNDNYDVHFNGSEEDQKLFNHVNRFDISAIFGITYEHGKLSAQLYVDRGFMATSEGADILRIIEHQGSTSNVDVTIPNGNNMAYMFSVSYNLGSF